MALRMESIFCTLWSSQMLTHLTSRRGEPRLTCQGNISFSATLHGVHSSGSPKLCCHRCWDLRISTDRLAPLLTLDRLPGWDEHSVGVHSDDGKAFVGGKQPRDFAPPCHYKGGVLGLGLDCTGNVFFTQNGGCASYLS